MKLKIIVIFLIMLFIPIVCYAEDVSEITLSSNKNLINNGEEVEISFSIEGEKTAAYLLNIYYDESKFDFVSGSEQFSVQNGTIKILWYDSQGGSGAKLGELGSIILKAKEEGIFELTADGEFYDGNSNLIETNFNSIQVEVGSENNAEIQISEEENTNLETLAIENEIFYPAFDNNVTSYNVEVSNDITNLNILAIPENEQANVIIKGNENLVEGNNKITVSVTSLSGLKTKEYTINVYKRNLEEEAKYEEQQSHKKEVLEHAYELEKTSSIDENEEIYETQNNNTILEKSEINTEEKNDNIRILNILGVIFIILSITCAIIYWRRNKRNKK